MTNSCDWQFYLINLTIHSGVERQKIKKYIVMLACAMSHANMTMYIKYF
jgi:hypothetical protein